MSDGGRSRRIGTTAPVESDAAKGHAVARQRGQNLEPHGVLAAPYEFNWKKPRQWR
jgi:hypothetical protein